MGYSPRDAKVDLSEQLILSLSLRLQWYLNQELPDVQVGF